MKLPVGYTRRTLVVGTAVAGFSASFAAAVTGCERDRSGGVQSPPPGPTSSASPAVTPTTKRRIYRVEQYGVRADGRYDDTEALARLLTRVSASGGGVVLLPANRVVLAREIVLPSSVELRGGGPGATIRKVGMSQKWIICSPGAHDIALTDLVLETSVLARVAMVELGNEVRRVAVNGCVIRNSSGRECTGISVRQAADVTVSETDLVGHTTAIKITLGPVDVSLLSNRITSWLQQAIMVVGTETAAVRSLLISANYIGPNVGVADVRQPIQFNGADNQPFRGVTVEHNRVVGRGTSYRDPRRPGTADLISLHQCSDFKVVYNTCVGGGEVGITIAQQCANGLVAHNRVIDSDSCGIAIGSQTSKYVRDVVVRDNDIEGSSQDRKNIGRPDWTRAAIAVFGASGVVIGGNHLTRPGRRQTFGITVTAGHSIRVTSTNRMTGGYVHKVLRTS